jgi:hypothetical protein
MHSFPTPNEMLQGIAGAMRTALAQSETGQELVELGLVASDDVYTDGYFFQDSPHRDIEGTSAGSVVIAQRGGWGSPSPAQDRAFPTIQLEIYMDPDRDVEAGQPLTLNAEAKAGRLFMILDREILRDLGRGLTEPFKPPGLPQKWDGWTVCDVHRSSEPSTMDVPNGDAVVRLTVSYGVTLVSPPADFLAL